MCSVWYFLSGTCWSLPRGSPLPHRPRGALHRATPEEPITAPFQSSPSQHFHPRAHHCTPFQCAALKDPFTAMVEPVTSLSHRTPSLHHGCLVLCWTMPWVYPAEEHQHGSIAEEPFTVPPMSSASPSSRCPEEPYIMAPQRIPSSCRPTLFGAQLACLAAIHRDPQAEPFTMSTWSSP